MISHQLQMYFDRCAQKKADKDCDTSYERKAHLWSTKSMQQKATVITEVGIAMTLAVALFTITYKKAAIIPKVRVISTVAALAFLSDPLIMLLSQVSFTSEKKYGCRKLSS